MPPNLSDGWPRITVTVEQLEEALRLARVNYAGVVQIGALTPLKVGTTAVRTYSVGGWSPFDSLNPDGGPHGQRNIGTES